MLSIEKLIAEARAIPDSEIEGPGVSADNSDHVVGVLSDPDLKRLFCVRIVKIDALDEAANRLPESERTRRNAKLAAMDNECSRVKRLFWEELRATYPEIAAKERIGVRKGWEVVWSEPDPLELALEALMKGAA